MVNPVVFVVEDEPDIARLIAHHLKASGYEPRIFHAGDEALVAAETDPPALFMLDLMLPRMDGLEVCRQIRSNPSLKNSRVIFLSAHSSEMDRVVGLELGADDYIAKPSSPRELVARVRAVLRRSPMAADQHVLHLGDMKIDLDAMVLSVAGRSVETTVTEFRVMEALARSVGRVVSRARLIDVVWGNQSNVESRSIDVYVSRLREKIEPDPEAPRYLKTVRGVGYRMDIPAQACAAQG
jgi:two-component system phosphate regulon response regulator PhoB